MWCIYVCGQSRLLAPGHCQNQTKKRVEKQLYDQIFPHHYRICRNKRPGRLIFRSKKNIPKPIQIHRFCVLPALRNHLSKHIGFVYSPLWKITYRNTSVLCTPPCEKSPIETHRFCVLPPLRNHSFWWVLFSGWAFISENTVFCKKNQQKKCH